MPLLKAKNVKSKHPVFCYAFDNGRTNQAAKQKIVDANYRLMDSGLLKAVVQVDTVFR